MTDFAPVNEQRLAERLAAFRLIVRKLANSSESMYWLMQSIRRQPKGGGE
jgi:hypothetical protein